jgi:regulator of nucleoside diphosphate kinase
MNAAERNISSLDYLRLMNLIYNEVGHSSIPAEKLHQLYVLLETAHKVKSEVIPANVVTMNSEITVRYVVSGKTKTIRIVYPSDSANLNADKESEDLITVYNPLAISVLGLHEHDMCYSRKGEDEAEEPVIIDKILFQPEAHKNYSL